MYTLKRLYAISLIVVFTILSGAILWQNLSAAPGLGTITNTSSQTVTVISYTRISESVSHHELAPIPTRYPNISNDGSAIVIEDRLVSDEDRGIWLYNTETMSLTTVSPPESAERIEPSAINDDGTKIVFLTYYNPLLNEASATGDLWLYDTVAMTYTRVTTMPALGWPHRVGARDINGDGTKVVFESNIDPANQVSIGDWQIWLYDLETMGYTQITSPTQNGYDNRFPSISSDGTRITFNSGANWLDDTLGNNLHIWLYDTQTMTYTRVTTGTSYSEGEISADGSRIVFYSDYQYLDTTNESDIWLYDIDSDTYLPIGDGVRLFNSFGHLTLSINSDGTIVAFQSSQDLLNEGVNTPQIWLYDTTALTFTRVTTGPHSVNAVVSGDGSKVVFHSISDLLNEGLNEDPPYHSYYWLAEISEQPILFYTYMPILVTPSE